MVQFDLKKFYSTAESMDMSISGKLKPKIVIFLAFISGWLWRNTIMNQYLFHSLLVIYQKIQFEVPFSLFCQPISFKSLVFGSLLHVLQ